MLSFILSCADDANNIHSQTNIYHQLVKDISSTNDEGWPIQIQVLIPYQSWCLLSSVKTQDCEVILTTQHRHGRVGQQLFSVLSPDLNATCFSWGYGHYVAGWELWFPQKMCRLFLGSPNLSNLGLFWTYGKKKLVGWKQIIWEGPQRFQTFSRKNILPPRAFQTHLCT